MNNQPPQQRKFITEKEIEDLEYSWWNDNAGIISKVWEMNDDVSWTIRNRYIKKAQDFLIGSKEKVTVLELGCGSGWVGQMFASQRLRIIGTDFSESQIELAVKNALRKGKSDKCKYVVSTSEDWSDEFDHVDGVLIHCFLHHLNGQEIDNLLSTLKKKLPKGKNIWIYEPAFYQNSGQIKTRPSKSMQRWLNFSIRIRDHVEKYLDQHDLLDNKTYQEFIDLQHKAQENGWYLSPKEIPFNVQEFTNLLNNSFSVRNDYWATINIIGEAQKINMIIKPSLRRFFSKTVLAFLVNIDAKLCYEENYLQTHLEYPIYAFHVWECEV